MIVFKCSQGHISTSRDCPYCLKVQKENEEFEQMLDDVVVDGN